MAPAGWVVELRGTAPGSAALYLTVSIKTARFGWTPRIDRGLMLARETDAEALARYAQARTAEHATLAPRRIEGARPQTEFESENARLRRRIEDLESILSTLRRIRRTAIEQAMEESQDRSVD